MDYIISNWNMDLYNSNSLVEISLMFTASPLIVGLIIIKFFHKGFKWNS